MNEEFINCDCGCVCHTGWPTPDHPYGDCCGYVGAVFPRTHLLTMYDEQDLPPESAVGDP